MTTTSEETKKKDKTSKTSKTAPPPEAPAKEPKSKAAKDGASKSAVSGKPAAPAGYANNFKDWEPVPVEAEGPAMLAPNQLLSIFDVRRTLQPIEDFLPKCKGGIQSSVKATTMKFLGADGDYAVSPDPKARVTLKHGTVYNVLVFGRRRSWAALKLGFAEIPADFKTYKSWEDMVDDAYTENDARADMSTWDRATHAKNCRDSGMLQDQIAAKMGIGAGSVSQYLGVFDLPEAIQKMISSGALTVTSVRILRPLKEYDADAIVALAQRAVEREWTEDEFKEAVASFIEKQEATGDGDAKKGKKAKKVSRSVDYDTAAIATPGVKKGRAALNFYATRVKMLRAKDVPEDAASQLRHARKLAKEEGILEGMRQAFGIDEIPPAAFVDDEDDAPKK